MAAQFCHFDYLRLGKADKGLVHRYLCKVAGISRAQLTPLVAQHAATGRIEDRHGPPAQPFARRYTAEDVRLLAKPAPVLRHGVDALHGNFSGPATRMPKRARLEGLYQSGP